MGWNDRLDRPELIPGSGYHPSDYQTSYKERNVNTPASYCEVVMRIVNAHVGIVDNQLLLNTMGQISPSRWDAETFLRTLSDLVARNQITVMEFFVEVPQVMHRRIYFPKGTVLRGCSPNLKIDIGATNHRLGSNS